MHRLIGIPLLVTLVGIGGTIALKAEPAFNPANTISLNPNHPTSFLKFSAELPEARARVAPINTNVGLHVSEIEPGLFFVTDQIYQSAFLVTDQGVVVFDAPPSFGAGLRSVISERAPGMPITHLIMSHAHADHNGGGHRFSDIPDLRIIAAEAQAETLQTHPVRGVPRPTETFRTSWLTKVGGVPIELRTATFHAEDIDTLIFLPDQDFLMAVDSITPGEVPFMNFGATSDLAGYLASFDLFLAYDFDHFLSGHVSILGTREDVVAARDYAFDVRDTVASLMPTFHDRLMTGQEAVAFQHGNLAYRFAMESIRDACAGQMIERWQGTLSIVDLWADSHCETAMLYAVMH